MTDYGHDLLFGSFLTPDAGDLQRVVALAQLSEQLGLDLVTMQDHPYQARFADTWTLLTWVAAATERIRVAPNVANAALRPPAVLAKSVATLDLVSGGRVELGLGAGGFREAITAYGGPRLSPAQSVDALEESIAVIRAIWATGGAAVRVEGEHHRVVGAHPGPAPAHDIGIWLGAYKPRMLRMTGQLADGWLPSSSYASPEQLASMNAVIDAAAEDAGRDPRAVIRLYNVVGSFSGTGREFLHGPPAVWVEQLAELSLDRGISGYVVMGDDPDLLRTFTAEVAPAVRELVEAERGAPHRERENVVELATEAEPVPVSNGPAPVTGLGFDPTPDPGTRHSGRQPWEEADRPTGPAPDPGRSYADHERASGHHLVEVHDHLRSELARLRDLVDQVAAGYLDAGVARSAINEMTMRQNNWTLGAYCESYCRVVTTHHAIEDASMLPHLASADPLLRPVVDRLGEEHVVIHDLLESFDRALVALVAEEPGSLQRVRDAVDLVTDGLLSHLSYEERELVEPLARLGFY